MSKSKTILLLSIGVSIFGCSSSTKETSYGLNMEQYPQKRSADWCQKNYSSASVSARDRKSSAKHCDIQARQAYIDAKEKEKQK